MMRFLAALSSSSGLASVIVSAQDPAPVETPKDTCVKPMSGSTPPSASRVLSMGAELKMDAAMSSSYGSMSSRLMTCALWSQQQELTRLGRLRTVCEKICLDCAYRSVEKEQRRTLHEESAQEIAVATVLPLVPMRQSAQPQHNEPEAILQQKTLPARWFRIPLLSVSLSGSSFGFSITFGGVAGDVGGFVNP